jgi:hypothetical protein
VAYPHDANSAAGLAALRATYTLHAIQAGEAYAREARVTDLQTAGGDGTTVYQANVRGSGGNIYLTIVTLHTGGAISSRCTCPVRLNCKHGAAVAYAALAGQGPARPEWQRALDDVTRAARVPREDPIPLALLFELSYGRLLMRPAKMGARGKWIKTGATWEELEQHWSGPWREEQRTSIADLGALRRGVSYGGYGLNEATVLTDFGPRVWGALHRAADSGVEFVSAARTPPIRLLSDPVEVVSRLSRTRRGVVVTSALVVEGEKWERRNVNVLGEPGHGIAILLDDELVIGGFTRPLNEEQGMLLNRHPRIEIPADDVPEFAAGFLPTLRRTADVQVDEDVDVPEVRPPVLVLRVTFLPDHVTDLAWSFRYSVGDRVIDVVPTEQSLVRDPAAEERLLAVLPEGQEEWSRVRAGARWVLPPQRRLRGSDSARFATTWLPYLENAGVVVILQGERPDYRYSETAPALALAVADAEGGAGDWFNLDVQVSVDGEVVDFGELFAALSRGETHLILDSGTWFSLERPEFDQLRDLISEAALLQPGGESDLRLRAEHAGLWEELVSLGVVAHQSTAWRDAVSGLLDLESVPEVPVPSALTATLRPYQLAGYQWLSFLWDSRLGGILADDMGLGKTVQLLAAVVRDRETDPDGPPVLVVAPTSVVPTWAEQARRFAPGLRLETVERTRSKRGESIADVRARADIVVTSYTLLRLDEDEYGADPWSAVILDEAQFVKNRQAATYKAVRRLPARVKFAVTGTPLENNLMDLWSMLSIATPGLFPDPDAFTELYRKPIESDNAPEQLARLRRRVRPVLLRRTKRDVLSELPPKQEQVVSIPLGAGHRRTYDRHLAAVRKQILGLVGDLDKNRITILTSLTRLRQLSLSPTLVDPAQPAVSAKIDALVEMLGDIVPEGHRALVFSQFTGFLSLVKTRLDDESVPYVYLDGRTRNRQQRIDAFKEGAAPVFLISLKAGGFGLNLTEADYVFILDPWWNPAAENQAVDRAHRIGQDSTVMVYRLVSEDTIEEKVVALQDRKRHLFDSVMDDGSGLAAPLTADDIRGLLGSD